MSLIRLPGRFLRPSGLLLLLSLALQPACWYGFAGGGLPPDIKTVAVMPFDNLTTEPTLTQQVNTAVKVAVEDRLGLRAAGESSADAVVRGAITRYTPDQPVAYTGTSDNGVNVTQRALAITLNIEITDQRSSKVLWKRSGLSVEGNYPPGQEAEGRRRALEKLVTDIVDGAQSQW